MQFVARQEVVAPRALPVSTSRYLRRLRSCLREAINYYGAPQTATIPPTRDEKEKKYTARETRARECATNPSAIDIDRNESSRITSALFVKNDVRERGRYLIDAGL